MKQVERWGQYEVTAPGKAEGNPFVDYSIQGVFESKNEKKTVEGFYDGNGIYRVRFMPSFEEEYTYTVSGTALERPVTGKFHVTAPEEGNHGPVRVANTYHFAYEDGTPYYSVGTTCYVWTHQEQALQEKTLETLAGGPFNKIRFCIFPKHYLYNLHEPITYPYEGTPCDSSGLTPEKFSYDQEFPDNNWDFFRFRPEHFQLIEKRIRDLMRLGIEADIIVMHPYDRWGFSNMGREADDLYWRYVIARLASFRNVWWSLANEYDLMKHKTLEDWERYAAILCEKDPYNHLRSIHNCRPFYDHSRPWITHCSIQRTDVYRTAEYTDEWRERFGKPVVLDEICYEGDIELGWGNIDGQELVRRFWEAACRGGYGGHGETFVRPDGILWWSHGGSLHGESAPRFQFLLDILKQTPGHGLRSKPACWDSVCGIPDSIFDHEAYELHYYGFACPSARSFRMKEGVSYRVEVIDTWAMTIEDRGVYSGSFSIALPGKRYMAIRLRRED